MGERTTKGTTCARAAAAARRLLAAALATLIATAAPASPCTSTPTVAGKLAKRGPTGGAYPDKVTVSRATGDGPIPAGADVAACEMTHGTPVHGVSYSRTGAWDHWHGAYQEWTKRGAGTSARHLLVVWVPGTAPVTGEATVRDAGGVPRMEKLVFDDWTPPRPPDGGDEDPCRSRATDHRIAIGEPVALTLPWPRSGGRYEHPLTFSWRGQAPEWQWELTVGGDTHAGVPNTRENAVRHTVQNASGKTVWGRVRARCVNGEYGEWTRSAAVTIGAPPRCAPVAEGLRLALGAPRGDTTSSVTQAFVDWGALRDPKLAGWTVRLKDRAKHVWGQKASAGPPQVFALENLPVAGTLRAAVRARCTNGLEGEERESAWTSIQTACLETVQGVRLSPSGRVDGVHRVRVSWTGAPGADVVVSAEGSPAASREDVASPVTLGVPGLLAHDAVVARVSARCANGKVGQSVASAPWYVPGSRDENTGTCASPPASALSARIGRTSVSREVRTWVWLRPPANTTAYHYVLEVWKDGRSVGSTGFYASDGESALEVAGGHPSQPIGVEVRTQCHDGSRATKSYTVYPTDG